MAVGIGTATRVPAKSLLGNRFVGRHPAVRAAAVDVGSSQSAATPARREGIEGVTANKAIPEERLGRYPPRSMRG